MAPAMALLFRLQASAAMVLALLAQHGQAAHFLRAGQVDEKDATLSLVLELGGGLSPQRHAEFEDALRTTYSALPKDSYGHLGHKAVRYVLHRLFVQRHGWYIKGLDPGTDGNISGMEWVPSFLQERLEERSGERGADLSELAALAAALEDLVQKEVSRRLETAYEVHELPLDLPISREQMVDVTNTYFISFLVANKLSAASPEEIHRKQRLFVEKYKGWPEAKAWLEKTILNMSNAENGTEPEAVDADASFSFESVTSSAIKIGEQYHDLNDRECRDLKSTLLGMEDHKAGRVRLSEFYKMGMHSHWRFTEKAEYLRSLGALDTSDPVKPRVIVPNYVMGRMNCLEASNMYALCCRNECEDLMGHLESEIGTAEVKPARVAELVAALPSDTVQAPRNLSASLLARLDEVAARNGGAVPLHSRLFAQWMHHAFPRECPYPHEAGTTSAQTPDEWMQETGHSSSAATEEEMIKQVESECTVRYDGSTPGVGEVAEEESSELPWTDVEEHFAVMPAPTASKRRILLGLRGAKILLVGLLSFLAFLITTGWRCVAWRQLRGRRGLLDGDLDGSEGNKWAQSLGSRVALCLAACILVTAAYFLELLDTTVFAVAILGSVAVSIANRNRRLTFKVV